MQADTPGELDKNDDDDFNPVGTMAVLGVYFMILVLMWIFMYFVEFLGGDATIIAR